MNMNRERLEHQRRILNHIGIDIWATKQAVLDHYTTVDEFWRDQVHASLDFEYTQVFDDQPPVFKIEEKAISVFPLPQVQENIDQQSNTVISSIESQFDTSDHLITSIGQINDFRLTAIRYNQNLIIINTTDLSEDEFILLSHIIQSLKAAEYHLQWPFTTIIGLERDQIVHANMYVKGFIDSLACRLCVTLGDLPTGIDLSIQKKFKMKSLQDMLDNPKEKQALWSILKTL